MNGNIDFTVGNSFFWLLAIVPQSCATGRQDAMEMNCRAGIYDREEFTKAEFIQRDKPSAVWIAVKCQDIVSSRLIIFL